MFNTDQQTVNDLNIFGKHAGKSIYGIFNQTRTRGGAALLEEMFQGPLSDAAAINKRSNLIRHYALVEAFPFDTELFDSVEQYLDNRDQRSKISAQGDLLSNKISQLVLDDPNYKFIRRGVTALIELICCLRDFVADTERDDILFDQKNIADLLKSPMIGSLTREDIKGRLSYAQLAVYDQQLRFDHQEKMHQILRFIYHLDIYISIGKIAAERKFVFPVAMPKEQDELVLEGLYHPYVEHPVANDLRLGSSGHVVFLTGANMAGKSTFMKSLGVAMYLAHMGFPVAATKMRFGVYDGIYTTINLPDNLGMNTSHFYAEVLRIKKIAIELRRSQRLVVIIDELFRGTNVKDAYEATVAVTSVFADKKDALFLISTHITEAGTALSESGKNIIFKYLPTRMDGNRPVYTYRLETGITADRHGMMIINNEGILDILKQGEGQLNSIG